jgi:hypothetical protein
MIFSKRFYGRAKASLVATVVRTNREEHGFTICAKPDFRGAARCDT